VTEDVSLITLINNYISENNFTLPVFDRIAMRLLELVQSENYDLKEVEKLIHYDQILVSEVLRLANSPFFKGLVEIKSIGKAVVRLGGEQVAELAIMAAEKDKYKAADSVLNDLTKKLWQGSVACGMTTKWIAGKINSEDKQHAFLAGLIHDIGQLFLFTVIDMIRSSGQIKISFPLEMIMETVAILHEEKGREILKKWNMPEIYCQIAGNHHSVEFDENNILLVMVRLADLACRKQGFGLNSDPAVVLAASEEANILGLSDIDLAQMEIMMEDTLNLI
jgi:HD-like signal output (HDOD) protein